MKGEELPAHGSVWKAELDVSLDTAKQRGIVVFKQVRRDDHHAVKAIQLLHQAVAVLVDAGGARFAGGDTLGIRWTPFFGQGNAKLS